MTQERAWFGFRIDLNQLAKRYESGTQICIGHQSTSSDRNVADTSAQSTIDDSSLLALAMSLEKVA